MRIVASLLVPAVVMATMLWWGAEGGTGAGGQRIHALRWLVPAVLGPALVLLLLFLPPLPRRHGELARRVDEFQRRFRDELAHTPGGLEADTWRDRLERHRGEVERSLCHGLGRGSRRRRRRTAALLQGGWQQLVACMEQRARAGAAQLLADAGIDTLVQHALAGALGAAADRGTRATAAGGGLPVAAEGGSASGEPPAEGAPVAVAVSGGQSDGPPEDASSLPSEPPPDAAPAVYEAAAFAEAVADARRSVALEGGVYRIRDELYAPPSRPSLRQVAEGALTDDKLAQLVAAGSRRQRRIPVTAQGIRYDQLLAQYAGSRAPHVRARVLQERCRCLGAAGAAVLVQEEGGYRMTLAVGCLAALAGTFVVAAGSALYDDYLEARRYLVVGARTAGRAWSRYAENLAAVEAGAGGRLALLPAILDACPAYLLFAGSAPAAAGRTGGGWDLATLITGLNLHP